MYTWNRAIITRAPVADIIQTHVIARAFQQAVQAGGMDSLFQNRFQRLQYGPARAFNSANLRDIDIADLFGRFDHFCHDLWHGFQPRKFCLMGEGLGAAGAGRNASAWPPWGASAQSCHHLG
jgi:hypothetical protein